MRKEDEPDFYQLDKTSPLPEAVEASVGAAAGMMAMRHAGPQASLQINPPTNQLTSAFPVFSNKPVMKDTMIPPMGDPLGAGLPSMGFGGASGLPKFPAQQPMDFGNTPESAQLYYQRLRHMQHIQMFQQQLGAISGMPPEHEAAARRAAAADSARMALMSRGAAGAPGGPTGAGGSHLNR